METQLADKIAKKSKQEVTKEFMLFLWVGKEVMIGLAESTQSASEVATEILLLCFKIIH